jgi:hypothetical protein
MAGQAVARQGAVEAPGLALFRPVPWSAVEKAVLTRR